MQLLYSNAKQMKKIVEAKHSSLRFDEDVLKAKDMGFDCSSIVCKSWLDLVQQY
jgi:ethanolaminephosphotransferase